MGAAATAAFRFGLFRSLGKTGVSLSPVGHSGAWPSSPPAGAGALAAAEPAGAGAAGEAVPPVLPSWEAFPLLQWESWEETLGGTLSAPGLVPAASW